MGAYGTGKIAKQFKIVHNKIVNNKIVNNLMHGKKQWIALALVLFGLAVLLLWREDPREQYYHNQGQVFGTYYNIRYEAKEDMEQAIKQRLSEFDRSLSMFNPQSTIARINRNECDSTDALFEAMYAEARAVSELSQGAFDITVAPLVNLWGFGLRQGQHDAVSQTAIDSVMQFVGYQHIALYEHRLLKDDTRTTLDASAIAKGYGCDVIAALLDEHGCTNYLVEIGGEVVLRGVNDKGEKWRVGISKPQDDTEGTTADYQDIIASSHLNMATSGNYRQFYYRDGERRSHTIDPRTGYPVNHGLLSATVTASSCMRADALATACMVLGADEALLMIAQAPDAACYLIIAQGDSTVIRTSGNW